ncbi:MAG: ATP-grasp fold amidoligase family protein [Clostridia bacterium]|nr:ATP-grasp fold amidoligase family protein [Clostridia bacterium]
MNYKKIISNQEMRIKIMHLLRFVPGSLMVKLQYKIKLGRKLNLKNPQRYTEKLQWYKLYYRNPLMTQCSDKYAVREYIKSKNLSHILNRLYGVYDNVEQIDLNLLPEKFVLKTTNGSGTNYFCEDKAKFSLDDAKQHLATWLKRDVYSAGREWSYKDVLPRIVVEEYLEDKDNPFDGINDYKFLCFNGNAKYIVLDVDRKVNHKRNIYDTDWRLIDVTTDKPNITEHIPKPEGLDEMLKIANILSEDFPFVRVDLYWVNGKAYFGELTFYPWTGYVKFNPDEFDFTLGEQFILPF